MFFLYFGFIGLIVQYFKSGYHFPLRYFIYAGITAMLRLIIVNHESSVDTILFAGAILIMVIALCLVLYYLSSFRLSIKYFAASDIGSLSL